MERSSPLLAHRDLTGAIIGAAMRVHRGLRPGYLESVYQCALTHELSRTGMVVERERRIRVHYDGVVVGEFVADLLVAGVILVELKAVRALAIVHEMQLVNYLTATGIEIGLLLNFGSPRLEFRRLTRSKPSRRERAREGHLTG